MFYDLPIEIIRLIYEYDSTYHEIFARVVDEIRQYYIYENLSSENKIYLIYDAIHKKSYTTDSLEIPTWICISYRMTKLELSIAIASHNMFHNRHASLTYDIASFEFTPTLAEGNELHIL